MFLWTLFIALIFSGSASDRVQKPVINIERSEVNSDVLYLRCEYSETIIWRNSAGKTLTGSKITPRGESITIKNTGAPENFYTCTLRNDVSEETSDPIYERDLFKGVEVTKAVGDEVTFRPEKPLPSPVNSITWNHRSINGIVVIAIEWDEGGISILNDRFKGITTLDVQTGEIKIDSLDLSHIGEYTFEVNRKEQGERFTLTVEDRVQKPVINIEKSEVNPNVAHLSCEYSEKITWRNSDGEKLTGSKISPKGESITVINTLYPESFYTCTLSNGVSEETSDPIYEKDLFTYPSDGVASSLIAVIVLLLIIIIVAGLGLWKCTNVC